MSKFTVYTDKHNEYRWKFAANDESVVARSSAGFKQKEDCLTSLRTLQKDIPGATVVSVVSAASKSQEKPGKAPAPAPASGRGPQK